VYRQPKKKKKKGIRRKKREVRDTISANGYGKNIGGGGGGGKSGA